jgi:hypothetical protein
MVMLPAENQRNDRDHALYNGRRDEGRTLRHRTVLGTHLFTYLAGCSLDLRVVADIAGVRVDVFWASSSACARLSPVARGLPLLTHRSGSRISEGLS